MAIIGAPAIARRPTDRPRLCARGRTASRLGAREWSIERARAANARRRARRGIGATRARDGGARATAARRIDGTLEHAPDARSRTRARR